VSAGAFNSGFLDMDGKLWICGAGESGQIGDGETEPQLEPVQVKADNEFVAVAFGDRHSIAISDDGSEHHMT
jgi:alpha-tubulin suppressor-like RCC1 family protein